MSQDSNPSERPAGVSVWGRIKTVVRSCHQALARTETRAGLVVVAVNDRDRRERLAALTSAGRALMTSAAGVWRLHRLEIERDAHGRPSA